MAASRHTEADHLQYYHLSFRILKDGDVVNEYDMYPTASSREAIDTEGIVKGEIDKLAEVDKVQKYEYEILKFEQMSKEEFERIQK